MDDIQTNTRRMKKMKQLFFSLGNFIFVWCSFYFFDFLYPFADCAYGFIVCDFASSIFEFPCLYAGVFLWKFCSVVFNALIVLIILQMCPMILFMFSMFWFMIFNGFHSLSTMLHKSCKPNARWYQLRAFIHLSMIFMFCYSFDMGVDLS